MGFFSGIRRRIKKIIPKEIRPAIPFIAAALPFTAPAGLGALGSKGAMGSFLRASAAKGLTDDEADLKDIFRTGAIAATPQLIDAGIGKLAAGDGRLADYLKATKTLKDGTETISIADKVSSMANPETFMGQAKLVGSQAATDFGIKQAELNEKALEEYNASLLSRGIKDKADRRSAIFSIFVNNGYDEDEVNVMLDKYGYADGGKVMAKASMQGFGEKYLERLKKLKKKKEKKADGGRVGLKKGGDPRSAVLVASLLDKGYELEEALKLVEEEFPEEFDSGEFSSNLQSGVGGLEAAFGQPLGGRRPEPMRIIPGFAEGGDVDEVMEFDEEIITPDYLMKEEGVPIQEQVSSPNAMDELNSLSLDMFGKPVFELTEEEFEMLKDFASQQASSYSQDEMDMYEQYKYDMNEQRPGMPIMEIDDFLRMELGAARMGVAKGGSIKKKRVMSIATGKLKDYPGIKKILEMNKKGKKRFSKAEGGLMNLAGNEMDLRGGGFVPMGKKERADDVPARLSKNEFVMTADAVRAAGGGSVQKGADLMYDTMKKLEAQS